MNKYALAIVNVVVLIAGILFSVSYSEQALEEGIQTAQTSFTSAVEAMEQISVSCLNVQQEYTDGWSNFISESGLTAFEAVAELHKINPNDNVEAHIIDPDTLTGFSSLPKSSDENDYSVNYAWLSADIKKEIASVFDENSDDELHITRAFTNPRDGRQVVGFCDKVTLKDDSGADKDYILIRVMLIDELRQQWIFPSEYGDAEIGLITTDGSYVIRSDSMKSDNFFEFIRAYNNLTYPQEDELAALVNSGETGLLQYNNSLGEESYYVYTPIGNNNNWLMIGYVPTASINPEGEDWTPVIIICVIIGFLIAIDGSYFIYMNYRLRKSSAEAKAASEAKTRFLSSMSHDIRTPMNAVIGMTTVAMRNIDDKDRVLDCLNKVTLASNHLLTLINDILDISKIETGRFDLNPTVFSLCELMSDIANIVRPQVTSKELDLKIHIINVENEYVYADRIRLSQIFINILSNAVKYTPTHGSITLTLEQKSDENDPKNTKLTYTVADTGIGMSQEFIKKLFTPFTRANDSKVGSVEGSGLGLAITKQMVDTMNGTIDVNSELEKGSVFTVNLTLPLAERMTDDITLPNIRVLIVDDDEIFLDSAVDMLVSLGVDPIEAHSGIQAVELARSAHVGGCDYPVIIVDWKMPEMDGIATIKAIRSEVGDDVSIIILSAFDWSEIEQEALEAGANGFINKPLFRSSLYKTISSLMKLDGDSAEKSEVTERVKKMNLLVAEDNDLNWEITASLLDMYGITADRAVNGKICVKTLTEAPEGKYDAVLMDVQMPVMNGLEATKEIRRSDIPYLKAIPIIAMTANAFAEDVSACLDAGMNAHVAKPVDIKLLLAKLKEIQ